MMQKEVSMSCLDPSLDAFALLKRPEILYDVHQVFLDG